MKTLFIEGCYTFDPKYGDEDDESGKKKGIIGVFAKKKAEETKRHKEVFTDDYFVKN